MTSTTTARPQGLRPAGRHEGVPPWVSGVFSALQGLVLSLAVIALPALASYVATSADAVNASVPWTRAVAVGTSVWLLGHGAPVQAGGATVSLAPLGVTVLAVVACRISARRSAYPAVSSLWAGVAAYATVVLALAARQGTEPVGLARAVAGGGLVALVGLGSGLLGRPGFPDPVRTLRERLPAVPPHVWLAVRAGTAAFAGLIGLAALTCVLWLLVGRAGSMDVVTSLGLDPVGSVTLALAQTLVLPNLVVWAVSWLAGPGFAVGDGSLFAPTDVTVGPMPAIPLLGALPEPGLAGAVTGWSPVLLVAVGLASGWFLRRALRSAQPGTRPASWTATIATGAGAAVWAGALSAVAAVLSSGAVGPGRLTRVGVDPWPLGGWVALQVGAGVLVVLVLSRADLWSGLGGLGRRVGGETARLARSVRG